KNAPKLRRFIQVSTDEVYGSIDKGSFTENDPLNPRNPYSASKAGGDRMAYAYGQTYGLPVIVTRASNNFGPYQYPEKLIPLFVTNAIDDLPLPLYGDGRNIRDWLFVEDHCAAIDQGTERRLQGVDAEAVSESILSLRSGQRHEPRNRERRRCRQPARDGRLQRALPPLRPGVAPLHISEHEERDQCDRARYDQ